MAKRGCCNPTKSCLPRSTEPEHKRRLKPESLWTENLDHRTLPCGAWKYLSEQESGEENPHLIDDLIIAKLCLLQVEAGNPDHPWRFAFWSYPFATKAKQAGNYAFPMPFSVSNYQRGKQMNEPKTAWLSAFGFPRAPSDLDFTPAEKALRDVIKASRAPATPEQMEARKAKREAFNEGKLSPAEAKRFIKQERESFLEREFKNSAVTYTDAVRIHNLATPEEKPLLDRLLRVKRANQLKRYGAGEVELKEAEAAK